MERRVLNLKEGWKVLEDLVEALDRSNPTIQQLREMSTARRIVLGPHLSPYHHVKMTTWPRET